MRLSETCGDAIRMPLKLFALSISGAFLKKGGLFYAIFSTRDNFTLKEPALDNVDALLEMLDTCALALSEQPGQHPISCNTHNASSAHWLKAVPR